MNYHRPTRFNDRLEIIIRMATTEGASPALAQTIERFGSAKLLYSERIKMACIGVSHLQNCQMPLELMREVISDT